jgi:alcohol dehydrogenase class IV
MDLFTQAHKLLKTFKGNSYLYGAGVLSRVGGVIARQGKRPALIRSTFPGSNDYVHALQGSLHAAGLAFAAVIEGPRPNAPREDLLEITEALREADPDVVVSFGGGSNIDASKAAEALRTLGGEIEDYFGTGLITQAAEKARKTLPPHVAIQTAASSAAHLTKYSNITDLAAGQKKLIVDQAIVPDVPVFDHTTTYKAPFALTADGAMDGISHSLEVLYSAVGKPYYETVQEIAETGISLIVKHLPDAIQYPEDVRAREALCLGTDLGGYAIMVGGTNGGHLTSFSLVDLLSHGRACAIMNPYYTVLFAAAIQQPLKVIGKIYRSAGYTGANVEELSGRDLGLAVAESMLELSREIGFPTSLQEVEGFRKEHIQRALRAAKNPQLKMKLQNMPIPLRLDMVDETMGSVLEAAAVGDVHLVKSL